MVVELAGFGLCYLTMALLLAQWLGDQFSLFFINIMVLVLLFLLFGTRDMQKLGEKEEAHYFYFGFNYVVPVLKNFWIAYALSFISLLIYFIVEIWRHSLGLKAKCKHCCSFTERASYLSFSCGSSVPPKREADYLIKVDGVTKKFHGFKALDQLELEIPRGKITCVVGKNGEGKSTLLRVLTGQETIDKGTIYLRQNGEDRIVSSAKPNKGPRVVSRLLTGYCAQENNLPSSLTVSELIDLFSSLLHSGQDDKNEKEKYREDLLERLSLTGHLGSQYGSLSIGVKRKVGLLLALVNKPELILLDEPVAGLDDASQK